MGGRSRGLPVRSANGCAPRLRARAGATHDVCYRLEARAARARGSCTQIRPSPVLRTACRDRKIRSEALRLESPCQRSVRSPCERLVATGSIDRRW